jgi:predicted transcriptional regulator
VDLAVSLTVETVQEANPAPCLCVKPECSIREALETLKLRGSSVLLVCADDGRLVGIFTERDALRLMAAEADLSPPIHTVMSADPVTVQAHASLATAIGLMASGGYRRLPIVDSDGHPTGVLEVAGIVHFLVEHFPSSIYNLPPTPHQVMQQREGP